MEQPWIDITSQQPPQGARVLVQFLDGRVRIGDYNKFDWRLWGVEKWKPIPNEQRQGVPRVRDGQG